MGQKERAIRCFDDVENAVAEKTAFAQAAEDDQICVPVVRLSQDAVACIPVRWFT